MRALDMLDLFQPEADHQLTVLMDAIQEFIALKDGSGRWLFANRAVLEQYDLMDVDYVGKTDMALALLKPQSKSGFEFNTLTDEKTWQKGVPLQFEKTLTSPEGMLHTWEVIKTPVFDASGQRHRLTISSRNVTERKAMEVALREQEQQYRLITENMTDIIGTLGPDFLCQYVSPSFEHVLGYEGQTFLGQCLFELMHPDDIEGAGTACRALFESGQVRTRLEYRWRHALGHYMWFEATISAVADAEGGLQSLVLAARDIGQRKEDALRMHALAYRDELTGAANRRQLMDYLSRRLSNQAGSASLALCYMDLDGFKRINDEFGHATGDALLVKCAERIMTLLRPEDLLARMGGDEFVIVLEQVDQKTALDIAERLCHALRQPWPMEQGIMTSASIGVVLPSAGVHDVDGLLRHADRALYVAKHAGKCRVQLADSSTWVN